MIFVFDLYFELFSNLYDLGFWGFEYLWWENMAHPWLQLIWFFYMLVVNLVVKYLEVSTDWLKMVAFKLLWNYNFKWKVKWREICFSKFVFSVCFCFQRQWELNHHHGLIQLKLAHDDDDGFIKTAVESRFINTLCSRSGLKLFFYCLSLLTTLYSISTLTVT